MYFKNENIKNIKLPVSAPFHCELMAKATEVMKKEFRDINFKQSNISLISNVTADKISNIDDLKNLLISQIEKKLDGEKVL